ncbi:MAG: GNAT family N-acetyltransferase [Tepidisphaeraceae bacterium]
MIAHSRPAFLPGFLRITGGTLADYARLARFHYLAGRPATVAAVVAARFFPDDNTPERTVGVAVLSWPSALNQSRHQVFDIKRLRFGERLRWVNANLRTVSRVIVHPQFRSLGLSTQLIAAVIVRCDTPFVESVARMGYAHPLFDHAGFARHTPADPHRPIYYWRPTLAPSPGKASPPTRSKIPDAGA